jgi:hypothetical protein
VARDCCRDSTTFYHRQDVLCPMSGYGFVPETDEGAEDDFKRAKERGGMIFGNRGSVQPVVII